MKHYKIFTIAIFFLELITTGCNKVDNYDTPSATLSGTLIDAQTNDTVFTARDGIGNGGRVAIYQQGYNPKVAPAPINSNFLNNGTFNNANLFPGTYKVVPIGAFSFMDTTTVNVHGDTKVVLRVTPFLYVTMQIDVITDSSVTLTCQVKGNGSGQIAVRGAALLHQSPSLDIGEYLNSNINGNYRSLKVINGDAVFTVTFKGLQPNTVYYVRAGGRTNNAGSYYNYSRVYEFRTVTK